MPRKCTKCCETKSLAAFQIVNKQKCWRRKECRECVKKRQSEWHKKRDCEEYRAERKKYYLEIVKPKHQTTEAKAKLNIKSKKAYIILRNKVFEAYGGYKCKCCGETEPHFLSIDHINNDGYRLRKDGEQGSGSHLYRWLKYHNYPSGYQVLYMNCQTGKSKNADICPHDLRIT